MTKNQKFIRSSRILTTTIKVEFDGTPDKKIKALAYVFDHLGNFVDSSPLTNETAKLKLDKTLAPRARLFIGPPLSPMATDNGPTLKSMKRIRAYEATWKFNPDADVQELLPIPKFNWNFWTWCKCRVRGQVVRPISNGEITTNMPVCNARVHICEVDPLVFVIPRLPDVLIFRLRDDLLKEIARSPLRFPRPLPDPPPFTYDPGVIDPSPEAIAEMNQARWVLPEEKEVLEQKLIRGKIETLQDTRPAEIASLGPQPEPPYYPQALGFMEPKTKAKLMSTSATIVRQALLDNRVLIYPYLCLWPWFWPYLICDEIRVLQTDNQGHFDTTIWYLCGGDHPDLYFWVEYFIGGSWTTVYKPPLRCNTHWNYTCGNEVTLRVLDPRVPWCDGTPLLPGKQVAVLTIGNNISINEIQDSTGGVNEGLTLDGRPFGGRLEPHVWFGEDLIASGITHYRWSYRQLTAGNGITPVSDSWHAMDRQVVRHYAVIDPTPPDYPLTYKPYVLGPDLAFPTENLFQIQPKDPPSGSSGWAPMVDARENTASAFLLSHLLKGGDALLAAGKYELKLELFDSSGNRVNLDDEGVLLKVPTINAPFGPGDVPTVLASNEYRIKEGGKTVAFKLVLRVDNNPCEAEIFTISGVGLKVNANCGFVQYQPGVSAHISFKALHPNDLAIFWFRIHRGTGINVPESSASGSVGDSPINGYTRNLSSIFSKDVSVMTLLTSNTPTGVIPCSEAAFAETLDVDALATDGWSHHLRHLDRTATPVAFALKPII
jgi:hypothetical protein